MVETRTDNRQKKNILSAKHFRCSNVCFEINKVVGGVATKALVGYLYFLEHHKILKVSGGLFILREITDSLKQYSSEI